MFVNYNLKNDLGQYYAATINIGQINAIEVEVYGVELVKKYWLQISFKGTTSTITMFETENLELLQKVHSSFCAVIAGGEPVFIDKTGFIEPVYPQTFTAPTVADDPKDAQYRTLSDK